MLAGAPRGCVVQAIAQRGLFLTNGSHFGYPSAPGSFLVVIIIITVQLSLILKRCTPGL